MRTLYIELAVLCATRINYIWTCALQPNRLVGALKLEYSGGFPRLLR